MNDMQKMNEMVELKKGVEDDLLSRPGVTAVDVGYKITDGKETDQLAVRVYVKKKKGLRSVPKEDRISEENVGAATDVIERTFELHPARMAVADLAPKVDTGHYSPLVGGIGIGPCRTLNGYIFVGTLGCMVRDNQTNDPMMLTNFHVAALDNSWSDGDDIAQPSRVDGGSCPSDIVGQLRRAQVNSSVDAAVIEYQSDRGHACQIEEIGDINGTAEAVEQMAVRKRGRTTGLTYGVVDSVSLTVPLDYGGGIGVVTLRNQISIKVDSTQSSMFGTNGDSGSVVVDDNNNVVGLYFAGSTDGTFGIANHIGPVLDAMNVSICTEPKSILKDIIDTKYKDFIKEKEWLKDWKEKDFFENLIPNLPFDPRNAQAGSAQPASYQGVQAPSALQGQAQPVRPQAANCIDFSSYPPSIDPNPRTEGTMTFEVFQYNGTPHANTRIDNWGGIQGLNCGYRLNIALSNPCTKVDLTLAHFVTQASVRGVNVDGSTVGPVSMTVGQATPETITLQGPALRQIIVESPQNEVLLTTICCEDGGVIKKLEKEWIKLEKNELKEIKSEKIEFKEWKEIEWDHKLFKDIKDSFEGPGGQLPFDPRQAANVAGQSTSTPSSSLLEERLARLEAALSQLTHFIDPALRPDLQKGALKREADQ